MCCLALIGIPVGLIFKQPDLSTAIVVLLIFCVAMFIGGLSYKVILGVLAVVVPCLLIFINLAVCSRILS